MKSNKINLDERFTDLELFRMFNVECDEEIDARKTRVPYIEKEYVFNDIKAPLLKLHKRQNLSRGELQAVQSCDFIRDGITNTPAGSKRVADLAAYYASQESGIGSQGEITYKEDAVSAFNV